MGTNNSRYKGLIEKVDSKNLKTQTAISEFKKRANQASYDKLELMRDLATYEVSAADKLSLNRRIKILKDKVNEKLNMLQQNFKYDKFKEEEEDKIRITDSPYTSEEENAKMYKEFDISP